MKQTSSGRIPSCAAIDASDRAQARQQLRDRRAAIDEIARRQADRAISERLEALVARWPLHVIAGYWPMHGEPDLRPALRRWHDAGITIALPQVLGRDAALSFGPWDPDVPLQAGPFGTRQPALAGPTLRPDLIVAPCLGFDARGFRLGYGGGFYDRTLAALAQVPVVGVAYDACEIRGFLAQAHDRPLGWIITENRVLRLSAPSA